MNFRRKKMESKEISHSNSLHVRLIATAIFVVILSVATVGSVFAETQYTRNKILSKGRIVWSGSDGKESAVFDSEDFITLSDDMDSLNSNSNYSEDETICGTWMGKTLYRKVINTGALPNATDKTIPHGLSNFTTVRIYGYATDNRGVTMPLPFADSSSSGNVILLADGNKVTISTGTNRSAYSGSVIIEYVKK